LLNKLEYVFLGIKQSILKTNVKARVVVYTSNPSTEEAEAGKSQV
jgi:hypothetical protein